MIDDLMMIPIFLSAILGLGAGLVLIYLALRPDKKDE